MGFIDEKVDRLLCLESHKEATVAIGNVSGKRKDQHPPEDLSFLKKKKETMEKEFQEASIPRIRPLSESKLVILKFGPYMKHHRCLARGEQGMG